jgi:3-hydroxyisobutyrate dehydrogenase-like beta-hydroxyacid dehydrogenase
MAPAATAQTVGFIGAGQLGEPTVERLLDANQHVVLFARRPEVADRLSDRGADIAPSVHAVAALSDLLVLFLFSDEQLRAVALGDAGAIGAMRSGTVLLVHTTASVATMEALAAAAAGRGIQVVDAPVSGTAEDIRAGRLTVLLGGADDAVARSAELVRAYADPVLPVGPFGSAMKVKLVNNILFAATVQLAADAARLSGQLGVDPMQAFGALLSCSSASKAMLHMKAAGDVEAFGRQVAHYLRKDVAACADAAAQLSVDLGLLGDIARDGPLDIA